MAIIFVSQLLFGMFNFVILENLYVFWGFSWLTDVFTSVLSGALTAVLYFKLRMVKDGLDLGQIAAVFD